MRIYNELKSGEKGYILPTPWYDRNIYFFFTS